MGILEVTNLANSLTLQGFTFAGTVYIEANGGVDVNDVVVKETPLLCQPGNIF